MADCTSKTWSSIRGLARMYRAQRSDLALPEHQGREPGGYGAGGGDSRLRGKPGAGRAGERGGKRGAEGRAGLVLVAGLCSVRRTG